MNTVIVHTGRTAARVLVSAILAFGLLHAAGCGLTKEQKAAVSTFSEATAVVADVSAKQIVQVRRDVIDVRTQKLSIMRALGEVDPADDANRPDTAVTLAEGKPRLDAATAMAEYANLLNVLATGDQTTRFKSATDRFITSLRKVDGVTLSDEKAGAIGTLVVAAGGLAIEEARERAIRGVVVETEDAIKSVVAQLRRDLDITGDLTGHDWSKTLTVERRFVAAFARSIAAKSNPGGVTLSNPAPADAEWSMLSVQAEAMLVDLDKKIAALAAAKPDLDAAFDAMDTAHDKLVVAVQSSEINIGTAIDVFAAKADELAKAIKILRD